MRELKTNYPVDLHGHTNRSDGSATPEEFIMHAQELGMQIVAMTDHDVRPPKTIGGINSVEYAAQRGVKLIPGTEISCETEVEDCHLVCLGCDWEHPFFEEMENMVVQSKINSYRLLIERLQAAGYDVTWEEVLENNGNPISEENVQKKMIFELLGRKGLCESWSAAKIMIKNTPAFQIDREKPDPVEVIRSVHASGGIVILAHPYLIKETVSLNGTSMSRKDYIQRLIDAGLDGIEARYTYEKTSYDGKQTGKEIEEEVRKEYSSVLKVISGGSDYHADGKKGVKNPREIGECGLTVEEFLANEILKSLI